jgi:hypothetical protein
VILTPVRAFPAKGDSTFAGFGTGEVRAVVKALLAMQSLTPRVIPAKARTQFQARSPAAGKTGFPPSLE